ncbi:MAG: Unknown protein [uncultured Thiotrichaceae bacterium]|uniref:Uncharacterized protein n=1 Tax=uncultured Thiotrichaceae bacterium TaxID=298394 RepID=A0A6S6TL61_9GAMM|nr:MAG: Unknown protein [uncultured Thiotrichaceae bacterium]
MKFQKLIQTSLFSGLLLVAEHSFAAVEVSYDDVGCSTSSTQSGRW